MPDPSNDRSIRDRAIAAFRSGSFVSRSDSLAVEEPLEIRVENGPAGARHIRSVAVTMRTPPASVLDAGAEDPPDRNSDVELALGFLYTEGILKSREDLQHAAHDPEACRSGERDNVVLVRLEPGAGQDLERLERHFYTSSSCGVCGKASIQALATVGAPLLDPHTPLIDPAVITGLPDRLRPAQAIFECTGGLHAAGLFSPEGQLLILREDVGRHNAVDKLVGAALLDGHLPLSDTLLLVSGRASFELVQKAIMAGIPVLVAVGAPSSLAVDLAETHGLSLLGFARNGRFNVYSGAVRVLGAAAVTGV